MHMSKLTPSSYTYVTTFWIKEKNSNNCWSYRAITTPIVLDAWNNSIVTCLGS
jgi:hypothetical protein